jgi:hypothetical protein
VKIAEETPIDDRHVGYGPHFRRVDQPALGVEQVQHADMGKCCKLRLQHFMDGGRGHPAPESLLAVHAFRLHIIEDVILDALKVGHLLVEMARQQQRAVVELAFGDLQRAIAELQDETGGAERDRDHQGNSAKNQPLNRAHRCAGRHAVRVRELTLGTHHV